MKIKQALIFVLLLTMSLTSSRTLKKKLPNMVSNPLSLMAKHQDSGKCLNIGMYDSFFGFLGAFAPFITNAFNAVQGFLKNNGIPTGLTICVGKFTGKQMVEDFDYVLRTTPILLQPVISEKEYGLVAFGINNIKVGSNFWSPGFTFVFDHETKTYSFSLGLDIFSYISDLLGHPVAKGFGQILRSYSSLMTSTIGAVAFGVSGGAQLRKQLEFFVFDNKNREGKVKVVDIYAHAYFTVNLLFLPNIMIGTFKLSDYVNIMGQANVFINFNKSKADQINTHINDLETCQGDFNSYLSKALNFVPNVMFNINGFFRINFSVFTFGMLPDFRVPLGNISMYLTSNDSVKSIDSGFYFYLTASPLDIIRSYISLLDTKYQNFFSDKIPSQAFLDNFKISFGIMITHKAIGLYLNLFGFTVKIVYDIAAQDISVSFNSEILTSIKNMFVRGIKAVGNFITNNIINPIKNFFSKRKLRRLAKNRVYARY